MSKNNVVSMSVGGPWDVAPLNTFPNYPTFPPDWYPDWQHPPAGPMTVGTVFTSPIGEDMSDKEKLNKILGALMVEASPEELLRVIKEILGNK